MKIEDHRTNVHSAAEALNKLNEWGINPDNAIVTSIGNGYDCRIPRAAWSYDFMLNGRNVATYIVDVDSLMTQPGEDGMGRVYGFRVPYVIGDINVFALSVEEVKSIR